MIISIIFVLLIILGIGLPLVLLICPRQNPAATIGVSFPLGLGIFTFIMFLTNLAGLRFTLLNELMLLIFISTPLVLLKGREIKRFFIEVSRSLRNLHLSSIEKIILGALGFVIISSFINTFYWPVHIWDSITLYDIRAHIFASTGFMKDTFFDSYYISYPLLTSLGHTLTYLAGGKYPQFIHSLFYLSLGVSFYGLLREFTSRKVGLLFTLILLIAGPIFYHSLLSLTNLPFSVYLFTGAVYVYLWDKKNQTRYLILSALLVSLSTWTRSVEPFWLAIFLVVLLVSVYRKKVWNIAVFSLFFFPIREMWKVFQNSLLYGSGASTTGEIIGYSKALPTLLNLEKWGQVAIYLYNNVVTAWGAIFPAFILATISLFLIRKQRKFFLIFFITFAFLAVLVTGTIQLSLTAEYWYRIGDAAQRLSMLFYPLFVYCIALVMQEFDKIRK
jgi:hypothetical protein